MKPRSRLAKIVAYAIVLFMVVSMIPINNSVHASDGIPEGFTPAGTTADGFQWDFMGNSAEIIIGGYIGGSEHVVIPEKINGERHTGIWPVYFNG